MNKAVTLEQGLKLLAKDNERVELYCNYHDSWWIIVGKRKFGASDIALYDYVSPLAVVRAAVREFQGQPKSLK